MYKILVADKRHDDAIFDEFFISDKAETSDIISFLNHNYSHILEEDGHNAEETTNVAESAHINANKNEIQISLLLAVK
ncbi:6021_t:CDS:2, partial [Cetraspora pellucida]